MKNKTKRKTKIYHVPMEWTHRGYAEVEAFNDEEAIEKAKKGKFNDGVSLIESSAELVDWDVNGDVQLIAE